MAERSPWIDPARGRDAGIAPVLLTN